MRVAGEGGCRPLSPAGAIEHRWLVGGSGQARWSPWSLAPFTGTAIGLAAISGWSEQVEVFVLDDTGGVWNPTDPLGRRRRLEELATEISELEGSDDADTAT